MSPAPTKDKACYDGEEGKGLLTIGLDRLTQRVQKPVCQIGNTV